MIFNNSTTLLLIQKNIIFKRKIFLFFLQSLKLLEFHYFSKYKIVYYAVEKNKSDFEIFESSLLKTIIIIGMLWLS